MGQGWRCVEIQLWHGPPSIPRPGPGRKYFDLSTIFWRHFFSLSFLHYYCMVCFLFCHFFFMCLSVCLLLLSVVVSCVFLLVESRLFSCLFFLVSCFFLIFPAGVFSSLSAFLVDGRCLPPFVAFVCVPSCKYREGRERMVPLVQHVVEHFRCCIFLGWSDRKAARENYRTPDRRRDGDMIDRAFLFAA